MTHDAFATGFLAAAIVLGSAVSALAGGGLADRYGRKPILIINMALCSIASIISYFASSIFVLIAAQLLLGIAIGMDFPTASSYISEIVPKKYRSVMLIATISLQSVGMVIGAFLGFAVLSISKSDDVWRLMFVVELVFALLLLVVRFYLPESPKWLAAKSKQRLQRAADALHAQTSPQDKPIRQASDFNIMLLFSRRYINTTILCAGAWFCMDIATYGVGLFTPVMVKQMHLAKQNVLGVAAVKSSDIASGYIDLFLLFGFMAAIVLALFLNKLRMQRIGFAGMTIGMALLTTAAAIPMPTSWHFILATAGFVIFNFFMNAGPNSTTFALPAMLYPVRIRAQAGGFAAMAGKMGATIGCFSVPMIQEQFDGSFVLLLMVVVSAIGWLITFIYGARVEKQLGKRQTKLF